MKRIAVTLLAWSLFNFVVLAKPVPAPAGELAIREIHYTGKLADDGALFTLDVDAVATSPGESSVLLLEGDVAVLPGKLPDPLKIVREGNRYRLIAAHPGQYNSSWRSPPRFSTPSRGTRFRSPARRRRLRPSPRRPRGRTRKSSCSTARCSKPPGPTAFRA
jgi:hypothetical protein